MGDTPMPPAEENLCTPAWPGLALDVGMRLAAVCVRGCAHPPGYPMLCVRIAIGKEAPLRYDELVAEWQYVVVREPSSLLSGSAWVQGAPC
jgi:hypothetical protein